MKNSCDVTALVKKTIVRHQMIRPGDTVLTAVSGGADSVCLLHVLSALKKELNINLSAAHLNHCLRGDEADRDEAFVKELCSKLNITLYRERADVAQLAKAEGISVEEAGRNARYHFFARLKRQEGIDRIATAHNQNDQAETILMRMMRGTGLEGLRGIRYVRQDGVIRPLLNVSRANVEAYCIEQKIAFCTDSTNLQDEYARNRVRHELLPMMMDYFNPQVVAAIASLADNIAEDADFIDGYAERLYDRINSPLPSKKPIALHIESLHMVGRALQVRLILIAARKVKGDGYSIEKKHFSDILDLCEKQTGAELHLPDFLIIKNQYDWLEFSDGRVDVAVDVEHDFCVNVEVGKQYFIEEIDLKISLEICPATFRRRGGQMTLDWDKISGRPLCIRNRRRGDRIALYQDGRQKKLKSFLIDAKIPRERRARIPLLCCGEEIAAVIGYRAAESFKPVESTEKVLVITYEDRKNIDQRDGASGQGEDTR